MAATTVEERSESQRRRQSPLAAPPGGDEAARSGASPEADAAALRARPSEFAVPGLLGAVLWAVVCWTPVEIELAAPAARISVVLLYVAPLLILAMALFLRHAVLCMIALPVSLTACFTVLEPLDLRVLNTLTGGLTLAATLTLFLVGTALWGPRRERRARLVAQRLRSGVDASHWRMMAATLPRLLMLVALFAVPLWALYGADGQQRLDVNFADRRAEAVMLVHTVHLFVAVLVTYLFFLSPSINEPIERAELRERLARMPRTDQLPRYRRNLVAWLAVGLVAAGVFVWLRLWL